MIKIPANFKGTNDEMGEKDAIMKPILINKWFDTSYQEKVENNIGVRDP